jgi:hypothetical protein
LNEKLEKLRGMKRSGGERSVVLPLLLGAGLVFLRMMSIARSG